MKNLSIIGVLFFFVSVAGADAVLVQNQYSRGNDDLNEANYETAVIKLSLIDRSQKLSLHYEADLDNLPHPIPGYGMVSRLNVLSSLLDFAAFQVTGTHLVGEIPLGNFPQGPDVFYYGRIDVGNQPKQDPKLRHLVDSEIVWSAQFANQRFTRGSIDLRVETKSSKRPATEMIRLIKSTNVNRGEIRERFPKKS